MERVLFKYNPQQMSKEELEYTFVGHEALLNSLVLGLKKEAKKNHHQHIILKGPRGIGKTHILSLVYFRAKEDEKISSYWIPLQFAEEEFGTGNLKGFFLRILEELIKEKDESTLSNFMADLKQEDDYTKIYAFLKDYLKSIKKTIVIMVDNIDIILSRLSSIEAKRLRDILMNESYLLIYGGAISLFKEIRLESQPFYRLFKIEEVGELNQEDFEKLLRLRFSLDGREEFLKKLPANTFLARLKALYQLTGGNPRLLLILYQFLALGELKEILFYLNHILDEHSQYFLDKIKILTHQQQAIIDTIAKDELLVTPTEIASKTGIKTNIVTAQISKLLDMGYLTPIKLTHPRNVTCYELGERIFRIWYQMRTGGRHRRRIRFLVTFLEIWYTEKELKRAIMSIEEEYFLLTGAGRTKEAEAIKERLSYFKEALNEQVKRKERGARQLQRVWEMINAGSLDGALTILDELVRDVTITEPNITSSVWFSIGFIYDIKKEYNQTIKCYKKVIEIKPDMPDMYEAWYNIGIAYGKKGEYDQAIESYKKAVKIKPDMYEAWYNMGSAYIYKYEYDRAIESYKKAVKIKPDMYEAWSNIGIAYREKDRYDQAIESCKQAIEFIPPIMKEEKLREFGEDITGMLRYILKLKRYEDAGRLFNLCEKKAPKDLIDLLYPIKVAIDYLITGDKTLIERQPIEFREIILDILKEDTRKIARK